MRRLGLLLIPAIVRAQEAVEFDILSTYHEPLPLWQQGAILVALAVIVAAVLYGVMAFVRRLRKHEGRG